MEQVAFFLDQAVNNACRAADARPPLSRARFLNAELEWRQLAARALVRLHSQTSGAKALASCNEDIE